MPFLPSPVPFLSSLPSSSFPHYPQIDDYARSRIITAITDRRVTDCRNKHKPALLNDPRDGSPFGMRGASDTVIVTNDGSGRRGMCGVRWTRAVFVLREARGNDYIEPFKVASACIFDERPRFCYR